MRCIELHLLRAVRCWMAPFVLIVSAGVLDASPALAAHKEEPAGYAIGPCKGTDSKPQSKLWYQDGSWWGVLDSPDGNRIFELDGKAWKPAPNPGAILGSHDGRADVLWNGKRLIVLLYHEHDPAQLFEFHYERSARVYERESGYPVALAIAPGSETMVLDQDSRGRLWASYVAHKTVYVTHSETDHHVWDLPGQVLQKGIDKDDISSIVAFGGHSMGVLWSDQQRTEFGFRMRRDGDPVDKWHAVESIDRGAGNADDHIHLTADRRGYVYAATKDALQHLSAQMRSPNGKWTSHNDIMNGADATRPILLTAEHDGLLVLLYTRWHEGTEDIAYRVSRLGELEFGAAMPFLSVPNINLNDVTSTKQPLPPGCLVAVADGDGKAWWNGWGDLLGSQHPHSGALELVAEPLRPVADAALALDFDAARGHEVLDASEHRAHGALGGPWADDICEPQWTAGVAGSALHFGGKRNFVQFAAAPQFDFAASMTLEAWLRRASRDTKDAVLCKGAPGERNYQIRVLKNDRIEFLREVGSGKNHVLVGQQALTDSLWHHVACVYDMEGRQARLYVDGKLDAAAPDSGAAIVNTGPLVLGARLFEGELHDWFHGDIDQVRLAPRVLYAADFVPATRFESAGDPVLGLSWVPRYRGGEQCAGYDVLRSVGHDTPAKLNPAPLCEPVFFDATIPAGHSVYRIRTANPAAVSPPVAVEWPPHAEANTPAP